MLWYRLPGESRKLRLLQKTGQSHKPLSSWDTRTTPVSAGGTLQHKQYRSFLECFGDNFPTQKSGAGVVQPGEEKALRNL